MSIRTEHAQLITASARASAGIAPEIDFDPLNNQAQADHLAAYHGIFTVHESGRDLVLAVWRFEPIRPINYRQLVSRARLNRFDQEDRFDRRMAAIRYVITALSAKIEGLGKEN